MGVGKAGSGHVTTRPANAGPKENPLENAQKKLQENITRHAGNAHAQAGLNKALERVNANAARHAAAMGDKAPKKTDLGSG